MDKEDDKSSHPKSSELRSALIAGVMVALVTTFLIWNIQYHTASIDSFSERRIQLFERTVTNGRKVIHLYQFVLFVGVQMNNQMNEYRGQGTITERNILAAEEVRRLYPDEVEKASKAAEFLPELLADLEMIAFYFGDDAGEAAIRFEEIFSGKKFYEFIESKKESDDNANPVLAMSSFKDEANQSFEVLADLIFNELK